MTPSQTQPRRPGSSGERGFTFIEVLIAGALLAVSLLALCGVFLVAYAEAGTAGRSTMGVAAAEQMLEDTRVLPFASIVALDNLDTDNPATQPSSDPAREIARRWRYTLAGDGSGWAISDTEKTRWTNLALGSGQIRGTGTIDVTALTASVVEITVTVAVPGRLRPIVLATRMSRL